LTDDPEFDSLQRRLANLRRNRNTGILDISGVPDLPDSNILSQEDKKKI